MITNINPTKYNLDDNYEENSDWESICEMFSSFLKICVFFIGCHIIVKQIGELQAIFEMSTLHSSDLFMFLAIPVTIILFIILAIILILKSL